MHESICYDEDGDVWYYNFEIIELWNNRAMNELPRTFTAAIAGSVIPYQDPC